MASHLAFASNHVTFSWKTTIFRGGGEAGGGRNGGTEGGKGGKVPCCLLEHAYERRVEQSTGWS
eukprot:3603111-Pleurochrysis_carterae.AAC.1